MNNQPEIQLQETIDDLKEYLLSDQCSECGRVALLLESTIQKLISIKNQT